MTRHAFAVGVVAAACFAPAPLSAQDTSPASETRVVRMRVGERVTLNARDVERFSDSGPPVVDIRVTHTALLVTAIQPGQKRLVLYLVGGGQRTIHFFVRERTPP